MVSNFELEELRGNIAIMITAAGTLDFIKFTIQSGRYFNCKYGKLQVDARRKYRCGKTNFYVYDTRMGNPLDILAIKKINDWLKVLKEEGVKITKNDIDNEQHRKFLGQHTIRFLESFSYTDKPTILKEMLGAVRGEKPIKEAGGAHMFPAVLKGNFGLFFIDNKFLKLASVKITKDKGDIYAENPDFGIFDVTNKEWRYNWGKANMFFVSVSSKDLPEKTRRFFRKKAEEEGEIIDDDSEHVSGSPITSPVVDKSKLPTAINVSAFTFMEEFSPYEPILIAEKIKHTHHQKRMYDQATKAPQKKQFNVMLILMGVLAFILIYQSIINPQISKIQTQMEIDQQKQQQQQRQQQQTAPPPNSGSEPVGNNPIPNLLLFPFSSP